MNKGSSLKVLGSIFTTIVPTDSARGASGSSCRRLCSLGSPERPWTLPAVDSVPSLEPPAACLPGDRRKREQVQGSPWGLRGGFQTSQITGPTLPPRPPLPASASVSPAGLPAAEPPLCAISLCRSPAQLPLRVSCRRQGQQQGISSGFLPGMSGIPFLSCSRSESPQNPIYGFSHLAMASSRSSRACSREGSARVSPSAPAARNSGFCWRVIDVEIWSERETSQPCLTLSLTYLPLSQPN